MYSIVCIVQDMYRERKKKEREFNHHLPRGGKDDLATIAGTVRTAAGAKWLLPQERYVYVARRERIGGDDESWILCNLCCLSFFFLVLALPPREGERGRRGHVDQNQHGVPRSVPCCFWWRCHW